MNTFLDNEFWMAFFSNALATIIGVAIGIPVALWLSKLQERSKEKERKKKILTLIRVELLVTQMTLVGLDKSKNKLGESLLLFATLKNEAWKAFSDGGELEWIKNPELLDHIAEAYYSIRSVMQLSEKGFDLLMFGTDKVSVITKQGFIKTLQHGIAHSQEMTAKALDEISKEKKMG